ncbi:MAG: transposase family protein [Aphanocapsa sp. GSE-SYN-MK-11-07L]|nr:transposase family protein [Aphanocapsa sp. GSE-SYN-MK-11-07L]
MYPDENADKQTNRALAQQRVKVEHGIRRLKRFRILFERY